MSEKYGGYSEAHIDQIAEQIREVAPEGSQAKNASTEELRAAVIEVMTHSFGLIPGGCPADARELGEE